MQFQFNTDNSVSTTNLSSAAIEELVRSRLGHVADKMTRVEVHVGDVNGPRGGADIRCMVELRPEGMQPISATHEAASAEVAAAAAADKALTAYNRQVGKQTSRKGH